MSVLVYLVNPSSYGIVVSIEDGICATFMPSFGIRNVLYVDVLDYFGGVISYLFEIAVIHETEQLTFSLGGASPVE